MNKYSLVVQKAMLPNDIVTPISVYLKLRNAFPKSVMLESSDYCATINSRSFIGVSSIANFRLDKGVITKQFPDGTKKEIPLSEQKQSVNELRTFIEAFEIDSQDQQKDNQSSSGLFGYMSYDAVDNFENISDIKKQDEISIPTMNYDLFEYILMFDHFKDELCLYRYKWEGATKETISFDDMKNLVLESDIPKSKPFRMQGEEKSYVTDEEYMAIVEKGKSHCKRGDVFQVVLSRRYSKKFSGDEFNVYRQLRRINPSPYLFFFEYGDYTLLGSSPEAQLVVSNGVAEIHPIAGTFKRTGDTEEDKKQGERLLNDPKENAEHVMLVDLARNDLSINCHDVKVTAFKETQSYSHVIHLTSRVTGVLKDRESAISLLADTFPAGTLSGAPKVRAMQIIHDQEKLARSFYAGTVGIIGFDKSINKAIMIRTFLSKNGTIYYQAGAGIVAKSDARKEKEEVDNKLGALRLALELAQNI